MALPPNLLSTESWWSEIADAARAEFRGVVSILDPSNVVTTPYDPVTGTGGPGEAAVVIDHRPARIQHLRPPFESDGSAHVDATRRVRVQLDIQAGDPDITPGFIVRVDGGGNDTTLTHYRYKVVSALNSSQAALRTLECTTQQVAI